MQNTVDKFRPAWIASLSYYDINILASFLKSTSFSKKPFIVVSFQDTDLDQNRYR